MFESFNKITAIVSRLVYGQKLTAGKISSDSEGTKKQGEERTHLSLGD